MIRSLDHLVITITDAAATRRFYVDGLGMTWQCPADGRIRNLPWYRGRPPAPDT